MPFRQLMVFRIGCAAAIVAAVVPLIGYAIGLQPANDTERELLHLATTYRFDLPGGTQRSLMNFLDGLSLMTAVLLAALGAVGYVVQRRSAHDAALMIAVARTSAAATAVLLIISLACFFIVPTVCIALVAFCFALASVKAPE